MIAGSCSQPNCISVSLTFSEGSTSPGALVIIVPIDEDGFLHFMKAVYSILSRSNMTEDLINATAGSNRVFTFELESENGVLHTPTTTAAITQIVDGVSGIKGMHGDTTMRSKMTTVVHRY